VWRFDLQTTDNAGLS